MRTYVSSKLHYAHQDTAACQTAAKISLYWLNMMEDIKNNVENCQICQDHQHVNTKEPLMP